MRKKRESEAESLEKFKNNVAKELARNGLKGFKIDYRIKGLYSLYRKYLRREKDIDKIYDIAAIRVLIKNQEDCYRVLGIIHANWQPLPGKIKDYIAFPKQNGYQGLHTTVFTGEGSVVEVQIKTEEMQKEAEYGIASHISYKAQTANKRLDIGLEWIRKILPSFIASSKDVTGKTSRDVPEWIRELADYQNIHADTDEAMIDIKGDFLNTRIFVFTPKGDVVDLPKDSSVIDFAYSIHSDLGNTMSGAKINGKMSAITTILQSGDIVEILTKKNTKPKRKWLDFAKTTFAKKHIRTLS